MKFHAGDWVEVKSAEEILSTIDASGELESMPFMAEMLQYCGKRLQVGASAHKTCDTINRSGGRRVKDAVHLAGIRCSGSFHGGCEANCLIFWKTSWLRKAGSRAGAAPAISPSAGPIKSKEQLIETGCRVVNSESIYSCQATRLYDASSPLPARNVTQYVHDVRSGNVSVGRLIRVGMLRVLFHLRRLGVGYRAAIALHDSLHRFITGRDTPFKDGMIPVGQPTPAEDLRLKPGDLVEVKSHDEIRAANTTKNTNRGMRFDPEAAQFCGRKFRVESRVEKLIDERSGKMLTMKSPCIVLKGVVCTSDYSERRLFCPREMPHYFHEVWLKRASADAAHGNRD